MKRSFSILIIILLTFFCGLSASASSIGSATTESYENLLSTDDITDFDKYLDLGLPLLVITTDEGRDPTFELAVKPDPGCIGTGTTNAEKLPCTIRRFEPDGTLTYSSGTYEKGVSGCTLKVRGNGSALRPKKPFKVKLQKKGDLLARGDERFNDKNWVLLTDVGMHISLGFTVASFFESGWVPAYEYVNVIINNQFRGLYILVEAIERNEKCRINVSKDGYIIENDCYWYAENGEYLPSVDLPKAGYTFKYPDFDELTPDSKAFIQSKIDQLEKSFTEGGYGKYIDLDSYAAWILCHDLLGTHDGLGANRFLVLADNHPDTKFTMGPVWDLDTSEGIVEGFFHMHYTPYLSMAKMFLGEDKSLETVYTNLWINKGGKIYNQIVTEFKRLLKEGNHNFDISAEYSNEVWAPQNAAEIEPWESNIKRKLDYYAKKKIWLDQNVGQSLDVSVDEIEDDSFDADALVYSINGMLVGTYSDFLGSGAEKGIYIVRGKNKTRKIII